MISHTNPKPLKTNELTGCPFGNFPAFAKGRSQVQLSSDRKYFRTS